MTERSLFICLPGVNAIAFLNDTLHELRVTQVWEAFDMDKRCNPQVQAAVIRLRQEMKKAGIPSRMMAWDPAYKGISSLKLLEHVGDLLEKEGYTVGNIDATIIAQKPKMAPHIPAMRANVARVLGIEENQINIKATTEEGLGFTGNGEGISSQAVCLLIPAEYVYDDVMEAGKGCGGCMGCPGTSENLG